jgi:hypothetical protein
VDVLLTVYIAATIFGADHSADHGDGMDDTASDNGHAVADTTGVMFAGAGFAVRKVQRTVLDSQVQEAELSMERATVIVPIEPGRLGRVRIDLSGFNVDRFAKAESATAPRGGTNRSRRSTRTRSSSGRIGTSSALSEALGLADERISPNKVKPVQKRQSDGK